MKNTHTFGGKALAIGLAGTLVLVVGVKGLEGDFVLNRTTPPSKTNQMMTIEAPKGDFLPIQEEKKDNKEYPLEDMIAILPAPFAGLEVLAEADDKFKGRKGRR